MQVQSVPSGPSGGLKIYAVALLYTTSVKEVIGPYLGYPVFVWQAAAYFGLYSNEEVGRTKA